MNCPYCQKKLREKIVDNKLYGYCDDCKKRFKLKEEVKPANSWEDYESDIINDVPEIKPQRLVPTSTLQSYGFYDSDVNEKTTTSQVIPGKSTNKKNKTSPVWKILTIIFAVLFVVTLILGSKAGYAVGYEKGYDQAASETQSQNSDSSTNSNYVENTTSASTNESNVESEASELDTTSGYFEFTDFNVQITDFFVVPAGGVGNNKYNEGDIIVFKITINNVSRDSLSPMVVSWYFKCLQDNDPNEYHYLDSATYDDETEADWTAEIKPGGSVSYSISFELEADRTTPLFLYASNDVWDYLYGAYWVYWEQ
ncbi:MAG: DUF5067 domain-containing protein [Lachnospiraceae bacterium]|nr:DUF5067 domain-containing protein [Lachnospiraceae bacterium]